MPASSNLDTQLDLTLIAPVALVRCPSVRIVPPSASRAAAVQRVPPLPAADSDDLLVPLCFAGSAGLAFSGIFVAAMALATWREWLPGPAAALFGLGGLLLALGAAALFAAMATRYSAATRYRSKKSVVARAR